MFGVGPLFSFSSYIDHTHTIDLRRDAFTLIQIIGIRTDLPYMREIIGCVKKSKITPLYT